MSKHRGEQCVNDSDCIHPLKCHNLINGYYLQNSGKSLPSNGKVCERLNNLEKCEKNSDCESYYCFSTQYDAKCLPHDLHTKPSQFESF